MKVLTSSKTKSFRLKKKKSIFPCRLGAQIKPQGLKNFSSAYSSLQKY
uniref:Macaca fascicularis brain cDNA, clone: QflA-21802 n=1 Tax=Macaca fascicularis TaxID=9541 RepID=I7G747_MACFA|nr:unnamed protein product [Macaca fascicularis]